MRVDGNYGAAKGYEPNSYGEWKDSPEKKEPPLKIHGDVYNYDEREYDNDYYSQPGALFRLMTKEEQQLLFENTARALGDAELFIKQRHVCNCYKADPAYGRGVAAALNIEMPAECK
jgi:catalase